MSDFLKTHQRCPCGDSSDAYAIRKDHSGHCFSCGKNFYPERGSIDLSDKEISFDYYPHRGLIRKTLEFYGIQVKFADGDPVEIGFPYGSNAMKIKGFSEESSKGLPMVCKGEFKDAGFFGQERFDKGSEPFVVVTEGEHDAPSVRQMLGKGACVSLKSGSGSAYNDFVKQYDWLDSFEKIYLCFDNDKQGKEALQAVQGLFDFRKVYRVPLERFKDANEYLKNKAEHEFEKTFYSSKRFTPDNIISAFHDISAALEKSSEDCLATYPFPELQSKLYGLHAGEIVVVKAPEGVGKTEFFRALEHHVLKTTKHPIGIYHLEEDNATTIKAIAGYELEVPAVLPDCGLSKEDILGGYRKAVQDDEGRIHIHASFDVEDEAAFKGSIRFLWAVGCRIVFVDHISWLGTGLAEDDERKKLDRISQALKLLAKELRICIVEISHVNDDGKTRGSRNISKVANTVISLDRDLLGGSKLMKFTVEKARLGGRTGPAGAATFDEGKGKLIPLEIMETQNG